MWDRRSSCSENVDLLSDDGGTDVAGGERIGALAAAAVSAQEDDVPGTDLAQRTVDGLPRRLLNVGGGSLKYRSWIVLVIVLWLRRSCVNGGTNAINNEIMAHRCKI